MTKQEKRERNNQIIIDYKRLMNTAPSKRGAVYPTLSQKYNLDDVQIYRILDAHGVIMYPKRR